MRMARYIVNAHASVLLLLLLCGCGSGIRTNGFGITPTNATVRLGQDYAFSVDSSMPVPGTWQVLSGDQTGTIDSSGKYHAPSTMRKSRLAPGPSA